MADRDADIHAEKVDVFLAFRIPQVLHGALAENQRILEGHELLLRGGVVAVAPLGRAGRRPIGVQGMSGHG